MTVINTFVLDFQPDIKNNWQFTFINGIPTIFMPTYSQTNSWSVFQFLPDGSVSYTYRLIRPYNWNPTGAGSSWFVSDNVFFSQYEGDGIAVPRACITRFSFDPFTGLIDAAQSSELFGSYNGPQWCLGDINRGANYFPGFIGGSTSQMYGSVWSSGEASGFRGTGMIYTNAELTYKNYTSKNNNVGALGNYWGQPNNFDYQSSYRGAISFNNGLLVTGYGSYYGQQNPHRLEVAQLYVKQDYNKQNCSFNDLDVGVNVLSVINIDAAASVGLWWGPTAICQPLDNVISCSVNGVNNTNTYIYVTDMQNNFIKQIQVSSDNRNAIMFMSSDNYIYALYYDNSRTITITKSTTTVDLSYSITVPSRPGPVIKTPATDTRAFYKSK
jgi:hypothetical protein